MNDSGHILPPDPEDAGDYSAAVGQRLRAVRRSRGLALQEVETQSLGEFKASVLGAYERGERAISVPRLHRLGQIYQTPVADLLPADDVDPSVPPPAFGALQLDAHWSLHLMVEVADVDPSATGARRYLTSVKVLESQSGASAPPVGPGSAVGGT